MTEQHQPPAASADTPEVLPPASPALATLPPLPPEPKKPGFLKRLFTSKKRQQSIAMQNGYMEMVDLIRSIRSHLNRQEEVQSRVLNMLEKVPDTVERHHEVMTLFKQQLETGIEHDQRLTESMDHLTTTLTAMDESHRGASRTITDLISRSRETEQLLKEVMRRAERRMTILLVVVVIAMTAVLTWAFLRGPKAAVDPAEAAADTTIPTAVVIEEAAAEPAPTTSAPPEVVIEEPKAPVEPPAPIIEEKPAQPEKAKKPSKKKTRKMLETVVIPVENDNDDPFLAPIIVEKSAIVETPAAPVEEQKAEAPAADEAPSTEGLIDLSTKDQEALESL